MIVDEKTGMKTSTFHETKNGMIKPTCQLFQKWKEEGRQVKILRMDGGGENRALVKELNSKNWKMYPTIEYTPRDTP